jgi:hypothetical protein
MPTQKAKNKKGNVGAYKTIKQQKSAIPNIGQKKISRYSEIKHKQATTSARRDFFKSLINNRY